MIKFIKETYDLHSFPELKNSVKGVELFISKKKEIIMNHPEVKEIVDFNFRWCDLDWVFKLDCKVETHG